MFVSRLCLAALMASLGLLSACSTGTAPLAATPTTSAEVSIWAELEQRPLRLPTLASGAICPAAKGHSVNPSFGLALGDGPAYPIGLGADRRGVTQRDSRRESASTIAAATSVLMACGTGCAPRGASAWCSAR